MSDVDVFMIADGSDIEKIKRDIAELRKFEKAIEARVAKAAADERRSHRYQNRTHDTETGTLAIPYESGLDKRVVAIMSTEYSSYLVKRGFSRFTELMDEAARDLDAMHRSLFK